MKKCIYFLPFVFVSCELIIDVDQPPFQPSIVVGSFIGPDTSIVVKLTEDRYVLDNAQEFDPIEGATVQLFEGDQLIGTLSELESTNDLDPPNMFDGYYGLDFRPTAGSTYRLEASKDGFTTVQATEQLPTVPPRFEVLSLEMDEFSDTEIEVRLFDDPGKDYYQVLVYVSYLLNAGHYDEDLEEFVIDSVWRRGPEVINIYSENIAIEEYNDALLNDQLFDGRSYDLELNAYLPFWTGGDFDPEPKVYVEVRRVSEAYFNYVNTSALQNWVSGDPFAQPVQAFSNVENGRGVLGSYVATRQEVPF